MATQQVPVIDAAEATRQINHYLEPTGGLTQLVRAKNVEAVGVDIFLSGKPYFYDGGTLRGLAADRPTAADAFNFSRFVAYFAVDTGEVSVTTGTAWTAL